MTKEQVNSLLSEYLNNHQGFRMILRQYGLLDDITVVEHTDLSCRQLPHIVRACCGNNEIRILLPSGDITITRKRADDVLTDSTLRNEISMKGDSYCYTVNTMHNIELAKGCVDIIIKNTVCSSQGRWGNQDDYRPIFSDWVIHPSNDVSQPNVCNTNPVLQQLIEVFYNVLKTMYTSAEIESVIRTDKLLEINIPLHGCIITLVVNENSTVVFTMEKEAVKQDTYLRTNGVVSKSVYVKTFTLDEIAYNANASCRVKNILNRTFGTSASLLDYLNQPLSVSGLNDTIRWENVTVVKNGYRTIVTDKNNHHMLTFLYDDDNPSITYDVMCDSSEISGDTKYMTSTTITSKQLVRVFYHDCIHHILNSIDDDEVRDETNAILDRWIQ